MKKLLLLLFIGFLPLVLHAQTAKAIWCADNTTLYFTYDTNTYVAGNYFDGQTITAVYDLNNIYYYNGQTPWYSIASSVTNVTVYPTFHDYKPITLYKWFYGFENLTEVTGLQYIDTSKVGNMSYMFYNCSGLTSLDVSNFNIDKVTGGMESMFSGCSSLTTIYCNDNWSGVSNSAAMFDGCTSLYSASSGKSYVSSDTNASYANPTTGYFTSRQGYAVLTGSGSNRTLTFYYGTKPTTGTVYDTDDTGSSNPGWYNWRYNIKRVVFTPSFADARPASCYRWFSGFSNLTSITGIEYLNTGNVTSMEGMFQSCYNLTSLDLSNFNTGNVTSMEGMFQSCDDFTSLDVSNFNTSNVTSMGGMFNGCMKLTSLDVSNFNTGNVTDLAGMFLGCKGLTSLDVSNFNTSNVTSMEGMFSNCIGLTSLDLSNFNTGKVTNMSNMFNECSSLISLDVSNFNTSNVTDMMRMFQYCRSLTSLDLSSFDTGNVTTMWQMFEYCSGLTSLDLSNFDTSKVTNMRQMFYQCSGLTSLDVSNFNTGNVTTMAGMFCMCSSLASLDLNNFNTGNVTDMNDMFYMCSSLTSLDLNSFNTSKVTHMVEMFSYCSKLRYIDFYDNDDTDFITYVNRSSGMFEGVPATTVIYLPHGSKDVTGVDNVVYTETNGELRCDRYYSIDKVDIEFPRTFRAASAEYSRSMTGKTYGSAILPYAFESNDDIQAYILSSSKGENQLTFAKASYVPAHTPFVFKKINAAENNAQLIMTNADYGIIVNATRSTNAAEDTWDASTNYKGAPYEVSTSLSGWKSLGYYIKEDVTDYDGLYFVQNDKFKAADGTLNLYDHRVLFRPDAAGAAKTFSLTFVDDAGVTAVDAAEVEAGTVDAAVYDASGRRMDKTRRGMNIVRMSDGTIRKVVVR